ncbi:MAG TPA: OB-fold domain-containing protein [Trebonia sp.]
MEQPPDVGTLSAPLDISFDYTRSLGPTLSQFMTALAGRRFLGARGADGRVYAPPFEYDPVTFEPPGELVEVGPEGMVTTWTWTEHPLEGQPLDRPFAWALIRLDGADTALLHAVDAGSAGAMRTGMRVRPRWTASPAGHIRDIECFELVPDPGSPEGASPRGAWGDGESPPRGYGGRGAPHEQGGPGGDIPPEGEGPGEIIPPEGERITQITTPVALSYMHTASPTESSHLRALGEGRLQGQRCPSCHRVYLPPRGACPTCGVPTSEDVPLPDTGTVTTFCVVNVPFAGQHVKPPYVAASVLIDGADIAFQHLVLGCAPEEVRMGMRVRAVWKPRDQWGTSMENVSHFEPAGEPDAPYESYKHHL